MFNLVADIEQYPVFLPWCPALRVIDDRTRDGAGDVIAEMVVAYKVFRERFKSRVRLDPEAMHINVDFVSGPFRTLHTDWRFEDNHDGGSVVRFEIAFELKNLFLQSAAQGFFERKFSHMSEAFINRAHAIYGRADAPA